EEEDQEADDAAGDEADAAAVADGLASDPDEEPEEEGPEKRRDAVVGGRRAEVHRGAMLSAASVRACRTKKNSPSRWRFRPPLPGTFALRLLPSGAASTYSRSVLGARGKIGPRTRPIKAARREIAAFCEQEIVHISTAFPRAWGQACGLRSA